MDLKKLGVEVSTELKYKKLLKECYEYARKSNHPSTHDAALLVKENKIILRGINILPLGVKKTEERFSGENKHIYLNHAERDVIYKAAKNGIKTKGLTMIMPWLPCLQCANAIISSGIKALIVHKQMIDKTRDYWKKEFTQASKLLNEAKVKVIAYDGIVGVKAYMHKEYWDA